MKTIVKEKLINDYKNLKYYKEGTFIRYHFMFNDVNVNVYFDAFDKQAVSFSLIMIYRNDYYYTSLNVNDTPNTTEYLHKIPSGILNKILVDNKLNALFDKLESFILNNKATYGLYSKDIIFTNTMTYSCKREDLPFWKGIRHVRMSDDTLKRLRVTSNIDYSTLLNIQSKNLTLVKTRCPEERKDITVILKSVGIDLELRS